ncbi:epidermal growth factor-like protein 7 isoform X4 [Camelus ferus]|uniref:Epidermal growth factor-like protein 7 isoform X4 n=1 Tax=Camelus ferus TaxID=419612 RepID=A0A8B8SXB5_CAMFR|nr:epidermal growth factor-like protein 7 isoform X4 [Camelus ferus]
MEHKKPPFLAPGGASLPRVSCPHGQGRGSSGQAGPAAAGGASRGRVHSPPEEAAVVAMAKPGPGQRQTLARGRHRQPPPLRRAAATSVRGMREPRPPGWHPPIPTGSKCLSPPARVPDAVALLWSSGHPEEQPETRKHRPCGAPGSCFCCGSWCWQLVAPSTSTGLAAGCVLSGFPGAPCPSPSCNACTSPSSPPAMGTELAAPTGPSTGPPTAAALGRPPPALAMPAAPAGRGPADCLDPVAQGPADPSEFLVGFPHPQQYASRHARTEGAVSSLAAATALQVGRETPARQTWMNAAPEGVAVPSAVSTPQAVTGASVGRGTALLWTGHSACRTEGRLGRPQTPRQGPIRGPGSLERQHLCWRRDIITFGVDSEVKEEVQRLRSRVDVLEQKLQLVLAPLHSLASRALEHGLPDPGSLLAHSLQQLDRIDSLSEQISFLEEQLGSCSCKKEL